MFKAKGDGNGGIVICVDKKFGIIFGTLISIMIFLLGITASSALSYGALVERVNTQTVIINEFNGEIHKINEKMASSTLDIAVINAKLDNLIDTLDKIEKRLD